MLDDIFGTKKEEKQPDIAPAPAPAPAAPASPLEMPKKDIEIKPEEKKPEVVNEPEKIVDDSDAEKVVEKLEEARRNAEEVKNGLVSKIEGIHKEIAEIEEKIVKEQEGISEKKEEEVKIQEIIDRIDQAVGKSSSDTLAEVAKTRD